MTRTLDARVTKLERQAKRTELSSLSDAELTAMIVEVGDLLAAGDDDPELTRMLRAGAANDGLMIAEDASVVEASLTWRPVLAEQAAASFTARGLAVAAVGKTP